MASLNMAQEELRQIEQMRNRFLQLNSTLNSLRAAIEQHPPTTLISHESLQASANILQQIIKSLQASATENADLLRKVTIHPSTNYPGRTHENILLSLLRKKLEPEVESWVEEARDVARDAGLDPVKLDYNIVANEEAEEVPNDPFNEQWADIRGACIDVTMVYVRDQTFANYTEAEKEIGIENIRTGLKRSLEDDDDEDEDEEDEEDSEDEEGGASGAAGAVAGAAATEGGLTAADKRAAVRKPEPFFAFLANGDMRLPPGFVFEWDRNKEGSNTKRAAPVR